MEKGNLDIQNFKEEIKNLSKFEVSLKSISFSISEKEIICYFTWKNDSKSQFLSYRNNFRNSVKDIAKKYFLLLNIRKSTASKYIFQEYPDFLKEHIRKLREQENDS